MRHYPLLFLGHIAFALGLTGLLVPGMPGVVFMIIAAWAYGKTCPHLAEKVLSHKRYGAVIRAWRDHGVIPAKAKIYAGLTMLFSLALLLLLSPTWHAPTLSAFFMACTYAYIISRPSALPCHSTANTSCQKS